MEPQVPNTNTTTKSNSFVGYNHSIKEVLPYDNQYLLIIDKLTLSLKSTTTDHLNYHYIASTFDEEAGYYLINENIRIKKCDRIEKYFYHVYDVFMNCELVGQLATNSRIKESPNLLKFSFENSVFYSACWFSIYAELTKAFKVVINNISYMEIAYDSYNKLDKYQELHSNSTLIPKSYHPYTYKPVNKIKVSPLHNGEEYIIGIKSNGKVIAIYDKSEANEDQNKSYITGCHAANGLDVARQIDRIELRLNNKFIKKYGITLEDLTTQKGLESLFLTHCKDSLSFYDLRTKHHNESRNAKYQRIDLIDFSTFTGKELVKIPVTPTINAATNRNTKIAFKKLFNNYIAGSVNLETLSQYVNDANNYLTTDTYNNFYGNLDLQAVNMEAYRFYTRLLINQYAGKPTPEALTKLTTIEGDLFYNCGTFTSDLNAHLDCLPFLTEEDLKALQVA